MKTIIEKLGISKNWKPTDDLGIDRGICIDFELKGCDPMPQNILSENKDGYYVFENKEDRDLCVAAPKMLEALIKLYYYIEDDYFWEEEDKIKIKETIEKATVKSWEEIRSLLDNKDGM